MGHAGLFVQLLDPEVAPITQQDLEQIQALYGQFVLDGPAAILRMDQLVCAAINGHVGVIRMLVGDTPGKMTIVGMGTLYVFHAITGDAARIGQFVVDQSLQGQGIGTALGRFLVELARGLGCKSIGLTSDDRRLKAHRFWEGLGFSFKTSKVMRMQF